MTTAADPSGFHIIVADGKDAYRWRTVASLAEPGVPADAWIGNACLMDHDHAAAVYAPRTFVNKPDLMQGGAFTAVVNLTTGTVKKLPFTASLAYFDPSCNSATHTAVFSAFRDDKTRLVTVTTAGKRAADATATGQMTSAVPVKDGLVAALGHQLVHVDPVGRNVKDLAAADSTPFDIRPTTGGQVAFLEHNGGTAHARLWHGNGKLTEVASGKLGDLTLAQGDSGRVFLTGHPSGTDRLTGSGITRLDVPADADISTLGRLAVNPVLMPGMRAGLAHIRDAGKGFTKPEPQPRTVQPPVDDETGAPATVTSTATATGRKVTQTLADTTSPTGKESFSPSLTTPARPAIRTPRADDPRAHDPVDTDRWCSVPRNDVTSLALQPTPNQVEWAVDMAVRGDLRAKWIKQGGWRDQSGLGTVDPQGLFPAPTLNGKTGARIPAQVLLGVLAQESNLWQAESGAIPGQMGNPLAATAGFYGHKGDTSEAYWKIHWENSDCGYGVGQVTDGMRMKGHEKKGETALSPEKQRAVALDYTVNIAASMYILADKWNELHAPGQTITVNNDDPSKPENWFAALWNYNLGFNPKSKASENHGQWGLGWYNNPANPLYPPDRDPFMSMPTDAAHPERWPYEEKVMGWAAWSIDTGYSYATSGRQDWPGEDGYATAGFRPAWWTSPAERNNVKPPLDTFCTSADDCEISNPPRCEVDHIPDCDWHHWWHEQNATWKKLCDTDCGHENIKYETLIAEPGRGYRLQYGTPDCAAAPAGALIVESVPDNTQSYSDCKPSTDNGNFQFTFYPDPNATGPGLGQYDAKGDLYQVGGGHGGHFWYAHTRDTAHLGGDGGRMTVKGTWTLGQSLNGWARVFVHLPDTGAQTQQAHYVIKGVAGGDRDRYLNTHYSKNTWAELGVYQFTGTPQVELSNATDDGTADDDVAFTSVAFQKLPGKPKHMVVAMGDSYSSGEGAGNYSPESDTSHGTTRWNACRRSANSWGRKVILPGQSSGIGTLADGHSPSVDFQNVTCSGAKTWQLTDGNPSSWGLMGNYHEKSQIDSGVLSADTTLVMLTIGGNDGDNFTNAVKNCYVIGVCDRKDYTGNADQAVTATGDLIGQIQTAAPKAQIVLMGYPHIVSDQPCLTADFDTLNYLADYLRDKQKAKVDELKRSGTKVAFADPIPAFKGHGICDSNEWINRVVAGPNGDGDFHDGDPANQLPCIPKPGTNTCLSLESFHPKDAGTTGYAQVMDQELADIGYKGA
ncbi:SGNH/GDSL hydrolase family protein [Streptomyces puniciscabiei]|uniref:SGNH/GDSL hydrolase family protein n=1 Tax=Streptomyces puniciscabiei TaxID=164348 RepID=UPI00378BC93A